VSGLGALVRKGEISPAELVEAAVVTIERLNPELNAVIHRLYEHWAAPRGRVNMNAPFAGVPTFSRNWARLAGRAEYNSSFYLKDVVATATRKSSSGSRRRVLLVGQINAPENGWSISTEPKLHGPTIIPGARHYGGWIEPAVRRRGGLPEVPIR